MQYPPWNRHRNSIPYKYWCTDYGTIYENMRKISWVNMQGYIPPLNEAILLQIKILNPNIFCY